MYLFIYKPNFLFTISIGIGLGIVLIFPYGCAPLNSTRTMQDTTLTRADSPYRATLKVVSKQETDTITASLSENSDVQTTSSKTCLYQEVVLEAQSKVQTQPHVSYLRARDEDCQTPGAVQWETLQLRGKGDRNRWNRSPELRQRTKDWLTTYLNAMYSHFSELN